MSPRFKLQLIFVVAASLAVVASTSTLVPLPGANGDTMTSSPCVEYRSLVGDVITESTRSYVVDNSLDIDVVTAPSASALYRNVYSNEASPVDYVTVLTSLVYSSVKASGDTDDLEGRFRRKLFHHVTNENFDLARTALAQLLLVIADGVTSSSAGSDVTTGSWRTYRCLPTEARDQAELRMTSEMSRLRHQIGEVSFGILLEFIAGTTLAFAIDDTGSMGGEIKAAKQRVEMITNHLRSASAADQPHEYVLVPFNDPFVYDVTHTRDSIEFKRALRRLYAHGGGDSPEMCLTAIEIAIDKTRRGSTIYVITDVEAKDYEMQDSVIAQAQHKRIKIIFLLTNALAHCSTKQQQNLKENLKICRPLYQHVADQTGGQVLVVTKHQILRATQIIETRLVQGLVPVARTKLRVTSRHDDMMMTSRDLWVDGTIRQLVVEATGSCDDVIMTDPNGSEKTRVLKRVDDSAFSGSLPIGRNSAGNWTLVGVRKSPYSVIDCDVIVSARTAFGIVVTALTKKLAAPATEYRVLTGLPLRGDSLALFVDLYGADEMVVARGDHVARVRFVDENGDDVVSSYDVTKAEQRSGAATVRVYMEEGLPGNMTPFYIVVEGTKNGKLFSRYSAQPITVSHVEIAYDVTSSTGLEVEAGSKTVLRYVVTNKGSFDDIFNFDVADEENFAQIRGKSTHRLAAGQSKVIVVDLRVPDDVTTGTASKITLTAKGVEPGSFQYHVSDVMIGGQPRIATHHIKTTITSRLAVTTVTSRVRNADVDAAKTSAFQFLLPRDAVVTNFTMTSQDGHVTVAQMERNENVQGKLEKVTAENARDGGGSVHVTDGKMQIYESTMLVPAGETAVFELTYQQLLQRQNGKYEYVVAIDNREQVRRVEAEIVQHQPIEFIRIPPTDDNSTNVIKCSDDRHSCHVSFTDPHTSSGQYVIEFDVTRTQIFGDSIASNGYFAHFFSAPFLVKPPKMVLFVIDAGSSRVMLQQIQESLRQILTNLQDQDFFNVISYGSMTSQLFPDTFVASSPKMIDEALDFIDAFSPLGGRGNVSKALELAFRLFAPYNGAANDETSQFERPPMDFSHYQKMIVLITTTPSSELNATRLAALNPGETPVHAIGFGNFWNNADDDDALRNFVTGSGGFSVGIALNLDAALQIRNFIDDVTSPLMHDVTFEFEGAAQVDGCLTKHHYDVITSGREVAVAGKLTAAAEVIRSQIRGKSAADDDLIIDFQIHQQQPAVTSSGDQKQLAESLWAMMRIRELLQKLRHGANTGASGNTEQIEIAIIELSETYNYVTPLTSLVIVRDDNHDIVIQDVDPPAPADDDAKVNFDDPRADDDGADVSTGDVINFLPGFDIKNDEPTTTTTSTGFYGDPHFVVAIANDTNLCFNWNCPRDEIYNIYHDPGRVVINAQMTSSKRKELRHNGHDDVTFVTAIAIVAQEKDLTLEIRPHRVIVTSPSQNYTLPVDVPFAVAIGDGGCTVEVSDVRKSSARVRFSLDGTIYQIFLRRKSKHLDFSILGTAELAAARRRRKLGGIIGSLLNGDIDVVVVEQYKRSNDVTATVTYNGGETERVRKQETRNPATVASERVSCWLVRQQKQQHHQLPLKNLFQIPASTIL